MYHLTTIAKDSTEYSTPYGAVLATPTTIFWSTSIGEYCVRLTIIIRTYYSSYCGQLRQIILCTYCSKVCTQHQKRMQQSTRSTRKKYTFHDCFFWGLLVVWLLPRCTLDSKLYRLDLGYGATIGSLGNTVSDTTFSLQPIESLPQSSRRSLISPKKFHCIAENWRPWLIGQHPTIHITVNKARESKANEHCQKLT